MTWPQFEVRDKQIVCTFCCDGDGDGDGEKGKFEIKSSFSRKVPKTTDPDYIEIKEKNKEFSNLKQHLCKHMEFRCHRGEDRAELEEEKKRVLSHEQ